MGVIIEIIYSSWYKYMSIVEKSGGLLIKIRIRSTNPKFWTHFPSSLLKDGSTFFIYSQLHSMVMKIGRLFHFVELHPILIFFVFSLYSIYLSKSPPLQHYTPLYNIPISQYIIYIQLKHPKLPKFITKRWKSQKRLNDKSTKQQKQPPSHHPTTSPLLLIALFVIIDTIWI